MSRTPVRRPRGVAIAIVLGAVLLVGPVAHAIAPGDAAPPAARHVYVVRPGDTVWSIASDLSEGSDPRILVDAIVHRNRIEAGAIVPGQALTIPPAA